MALPSGKRSDCEMALASEGTPAGPATGKREVLGQTLRTASPERRLARDRIKPASAPLSFPSRRGAAGGLKFGAIAYLISIGLVAAATVGVFFGLGFYLLSHLPVAGAYHESKAPAIVGTASSGLPDRPIGSAAESAALAMAAVAPPNTLAPSCRRRTRPRRPRWLTRRARTSPQPRSRHFWRGAKPLFAKATSPRRVSSIGEW